MVKFIDMKRAAQSEMNVEIEVDGEWALITRQVTGFAEADIEGVKRWIKTDNESPIRPAEKEEEVQSAVVYNPVQFVESPVKRQAMKKTRRKKKGKIPQFFAKREVDKFFTPDKPDAYYEWKKRRGHLFFPKVTVVRRKKIELYAIPMEVLEEEEEKPQAIPFAQAPSYGKTLELLGFFSEKTEERRRQPFGAAPAAERNDRDRDRHVRAKPLKPLEFQRLTEFGPDYKRCSQKIFCTPFDAAYWSSIVGTPPLGTLGEDATTPAMTPLLPDLVLDPQTTDFSWEPAPPLARPPTLTPTLKLKKPEKKQKRKKKKQKKKKVEQGNKPAPPPLKQLLRKTHPVRKASQPRPKLAGSTSKVLVKKAFIPPPPPVHE